MGRAGQLLQWPGMRAGPGKTLDSDRDMAVARYTAAGDGGLPGLGDAAACLREDMSRSGTLRCFAPLHRCSAQPSETRAGTPASRRL